jgi:hypothetical protein
MKRSLGFVVLIIVAAAFLLGLLVGRENRPEQIPEIIPWKLLPRSLLTDRELIEDLRGADFRLVVVGYGEPLKLVRQRCLQGNFDATVMDRAHNVIYSISNDQRYEDCRIDYSEFADRGKLAIRYYTWDVRSDLPVSTWKVEVVVFSAGKPPEAEARITINPSPGGIEKIRELLLDAARGRKITQESRPGAVNYRKALLLGLHSLNEVRNVGVGCPQAAIKALKALGWQEGIFAETVEKYISQLEDVRQVRASLKAIN